LLEWSVKGFGFGAASLAIHGVFSEVGLDRDREACIGVMLYGCGCVLKGTNDNMIISRVSAYSNVRV
jgi:hypothetical protein